MFKNQNTLQHGTLTSCSEGRDSLSIFLSSVLHRIILNFSVAALNG